MINPENAESSKPKTTVKLEEIYRVAAELITEKGFDATSMNDIASAVGLTKAGLYYYIQGKKELLYSIMNFAMDLVDSEVFEPTRNIQNPEERLEKILNCHLSSTSHVKEFAILTQEVNGLSPSHREQILDRKRTYLNYVQDTLQELNDRGQLREIDVTVATMNLFSTLLGLNHWYHADGHLSTEDVAESTVRFILGGLLKPSLSTQT